MKVKSSVAYTQLSYIESTGTQFIDTGFVPNQDTRVVIDFEILSQPINVYYTIFASRSNVYDQQFCIFSENNTATPNTTLSGYGSGTERDIVLQHSLIGKRNVIDKNKNVLYLNNTNIYSHTYETFNASCELRLLADNKPDGGDGHYFVGKLYSCQIYDNDILIRDYIPVIDYKNIICLFDKVSGTFFYNSGAGNFIAGETFGINTVDAWADGKECYAKVSNSYTPLSYIESAGTQFIDTEVKVQTGLNAEIEYQVLDTTHDKWFFGVFDSKNSSIYRSGVYNNKLVNFYQETESISTSKVVVSGESVSNSELKAFLFAQNLNGNPDSNNIGRLYSCKLYNFKNYATNKLTNSSFENNMIGWTQSGSGTPVSVSTDEHYSGSKSACIKMIGTVSSAWIDQTLQPIYGHKYYYRFHTKRSSNNTITPINEWKYVKADWTTYWIDMFSTNMENGWQRFSSVCDTNSFDSDYINFTFTFGAWLENPISGSIEAYYDDAILIDLTETFGVGNEPTREWCDENIEYGEVKAGIEKILIRYYIPVLDHNNIPCLFDKVSNKFFYNQGTGNFIAGATFGSKIVSNDWTKAKSVFAKVSDSYTPVDYIESTGTQYLDTGVYAPNGCSISCEISFVKCDSSQTTIIGACDSNGAAQYLLGFPYEYSTYTHVWNMAIGSVSNVGYYNGHTTDMILNRRYNIDASFITNNITMRVNNVVYANGVAGYNDDGVRPNKSLYLFATHYDDTVAYYSHIRIYKFKIYDHNNVLVRDFIPVIDKNGVACMYDKVHGQFYYNQGTGDFIASETSHTVVEYIESTGSQWVDTKISDINGFRTEMTMMWTGYYSSGYMACIGCHESSAPWKANFVRINSVPNWELGAVDIQSYTASSVNINQQLFLEASTLVGNSYLMINGNLLLSTSNNSERTASNVLLFGLNSGSVATQCAKMKLYSCKIYNNTNVLVRDYIPVRDKNNIACLYDKVESKYYYNQGAGEFLAPTKGYTELEYIESTGVQYVDTGVCPSLEISYDLCFKPLSYLAKYNCVFGSRTTHNTDALYIGFSNAGNSYGCRGTSKHDTNTSVGWAILNEDYRVVLNTSDNYIYCNNNPVYSVPTSSFSQTRNMVIFADDDGGNINEYSSIRLYYFKIYKNGTLIRNYIPVKDHNGIICLYDKVHNRYYYDENNYGFTGGKIAGCNVWKQVI